MRQFVYPNSQFVALTGQPSVGWEMAVYETGTTDLASIYSDAAQTIPTDNPVVADSKGYFETFYWTGTVDIVVTDEDDDIQDSVPGITDLVTDVLNIIANNSAVIPAGTSTGTGDAISLTLASMGSNDFANLAPFIMKANANNTGAGGTPNLTINALPSRRIKKGSGEALVANDITAGSIGIYFYNEADNSYYQLAPGATFLRRDGSLAMLGALDMGGFKATNAADGEARTDLATIGQIQDGDINKAETSKIISGSTTASSAIVTGMVGATNLLAGMSVTGTGIPASTTILTVDSDAQITLSANAMATGTPSLTFTGSANALALFVSPQVTALTKGMSFDYVCAIANTTAMTVSICGVTAVALTKDGATPLVSGDNVATRLYRISYDGTRFQLLNPSSRSALPVGMELEWPVPECPTFALTRDGAAYAQALYPDLFGVLCPLTAATTASGSATVTGLASTKNLYVGMVVQGANIAANSTIATIPSTTSVTLNNNATATGATEIRPFYYGLGSGGAATDFGVPNDMGYGIRSVDYVGTVEASALIADTANGNPTLTNISSTVGLFVGMPISGTGISGGTTISAINSATSVTMSANATATNSGIQLVVMGRQIAHYVADAFQSFDLNGPAVQPNGTGGATDGKLVSGDGSSIGTKNFTNISYISDGTNGAPRSGPETKGKTVSKLPIIVF